MDRGSLGDTALSARVTAKADPSSSRSEIRAGSGSAPLPAPDHVGVDKRRFVELPVGERDQELYELAQMLLDMESIRTALGLKEDLGRRDVERLHECVRQRDKFGTFRHLSELQNRLAAIVGQLNDVIERADNLLSRRRREQRGDGRSHSRFG